MNKIQREEYELSKQLLINYVKQMEHIQLAIKQLYVRLENEHNDFESTMHIHTMIERLNNKFNTYYIEFKKLEPKVIKLHSKINNK